MQRKRNLRIGRNSLCECGSGLKTKRCHPEYLDGTTIKFKDGSEKQRHTSNVLKIVAESRNTRRYASGLLKMANGFRSDFFGGWDKSSDKHPQLPATFNVKGSNFTPKKTQRKK